MGLLARLCCRPLVGLCTVWVLGPSPSFLASAFTSSSSSSLPPWRPEQPGSRGWPAAGAAWANTAAENRPAIRRRGVSSADFPFWSFLDEMPDGSVRTFRQRGCAGRPTPRAGLTQPGKDDSSEARICRFPPARPAGGTATPPETHSPMAYQHIKIPAGPEDHRQRRHVAEGAGPADHPVHRGRRHRRRHHAGDAQGGRRRGGEGLRRQEDPLDGGLRRREGRPRCTAPTSGCPTRRSRPCASTWSRSRAR